MRIRISRKGSKETRYWLNLIEIRDSSEAEKSFLIKESTEFIKIFTAILEKSK